MRYIKLVLESHSKELFRK